MGIALRWREEPFDCEFVGGPDHGVLTMYSGSRVVWRGEVPSAVAAHDRAQEVKDRLLAPQAKKHA
jgi:hypothetical protein